MKKHQREPTSGWHSRLLFALSFFSALIFCLTAAGGCYRISPEDVKLVPLIDPIYYDCVEATPQQLYEAYYYRYGDIFMASSKYNGLYFVFKDIEVTSLMFNHLDEGLIWVENTIRCYLSDTGEMMRFDIGDRVDIVGKNQGYVMGVSGLTFQDCRVLPAGIIQLPSVEAVFVPSY